MVTPVEPTLGAIAIKVGSYGATVVLAVVTALWARKADVGRMIDQRWESLSNRMDSRLLATEARADKAEARADKAADHAEKCEAELAEVRAEVRAAMSGKIAGYPLIVNPKGADQP